MDSYVGEIRMFGGNFAPFNWAFCNGATMQIRQYPALYSILGTRFGGNGSTTFNLPNLQGSVPMGMGAGSGLTPRSLGSTGGSTSVQLTGSLMAVHGHPVNCQATSGVTAGAAAVPNGNYPAPSDYTRQTEKYADTPYNAAADGSQMNAAMVGFTGGTNGSALPHNNVQPYLAMNFIISLAGIFPAPPGQGG